MVWIHGGGFKMGTAASTMYGPDNLLEGDVVIVATGYRLGILGNKFDADVKPLRDKADIYNKSYFFIILKGFYY
jgi:carboxylesterase type B